MPSMLYKSSAVALILAGPVMLVLAVGCLLINLRLSEDSPLLIPAWSTRAVSWTFAANIALALPLIAVVIDAFNGWPIVYAISETPIYPALFVGVFVLAVGCSLCSIAFTISISLLGIGFFRGIDRAEPAGLSSTLPTTTT